ncbi:MAG: DUF5318 family protein [Acidimicrobiales bacterium]
MTFVPESLRTVSALGQVSSSINYRLARNAAVEDVHQGRVMPEDACDAHSELVRAAANVGERAKEECPVCLSDELRLVSYAFGKRLPPGGRCLSSKKELSRLSQSVSEITCYVVEVCPSCSWHHLSRRFSVGGRKLPSAAGRGGAR